MLISNNHAYFSVTSHVLNDVNVREDNVKTRHTINQYWSEVNSVLTGKKDIESENYGCEMHACKLFVLENTAYLPYFVKIFPCNPKKNIYSVYECGFVKVCNYLS